MLSYIKSKLKSFYYRKIKKMSSEEITVHRLRSLGMTVGENNYIYSDLETAESYLVTIGDNNLIAPGVRFTTHDASAGKYIPGASDIFGRIVVGSNCFVGMGAIILPGVTIADNCIIGAGSVLTKSFTEAGKVIAGNPARVICTVEELREKNEGYALNVWGKTYEEKKEYILANENRFKGYKSNVK